MDTGDSGDGPLISVIIPAWNAAGLIGETLRSVLGQSWRNLEVVVVDDGSTDDTAGVVNRVQDARIRLIRQENRGQSAALNRGAAEARGEYLKFLDADDCLNAGHLEALAGAVRGFPGCVASCRWGYFVTDPATVVAREEKADRDYDDPLEWLVDSLVLDEGMMGGWKWLIPRAVWDRCGGWDERLGLNNDFDFSIRLLLAAEGVRVAPEAVYAYRKGVAGALSGSRGRKAMTSAFQTTESGCRALLAREDSARIRQICADRWQGWLFQFYPEFPDLAAAAEAEIARLGGSALRLQGGRLLRLLQPVIGWRGVRRLQVRVYQSGWKRVLQFKEARRLAKLEARS